MTNWVDIAALEDIPRLGSRVVQTDTIQIAIFRTASDSVFALKDACPHRGGPLSQGIVHDSTVTCPLHNWKIDLLSGKAKAPDEGCVRTFPVRLDAGRIYLGLASQESRCSNTPSTADQNSAIQISQFNKEVSSCHI